MNVHDLEAWILRAQLSLRDDQPQVSRIELEKALQHLATCAPRADDFDTWQANPYTKVLQKSIAKDYVPCADAEKDAGRLDFLIDKGAAVESICGRYRVAKDYTLFSNWCDSPREAIDAAILAADKGK